jgi:hypothetical protein
MPITAEVAMKTSKRCGRPREMTMLGTAGGSAPAILLIQTVDKCRAFCSAFNGVIVPKQTA